MKGDGGGWGGRLFEVRRLLTFFSLQDGRLFETGGNARLDAYYNQINSASSTKMNVQISSL